MKKKEVLNNLNMHFLLDLLLGQTCQNIKVLKFYSSLLAFKYISNHNFFFPSKAVFTIHSWSKLAKLANRGQQWYKSSKILIFTVYYLLFTCYYFNIYIMVS